MDPIADFLTSIRNGYLAKKDSVSVPYSKTKHTLADLLVSRGFLAKADKTEEGKLELSLRYLPKGGAILTGVKRISKPGVRRYATADSIPSALSGSGLTIVSTSKGIMTDKEARKARLGGEIICQVW